MYGQAPSRGTADPTGPPFRSGRNARLFEELSGVRMSELQRRWVFRNVLRYYPGRAAGGGDRFPVREARTAAAAEMADWLAGDRVVFAGRSVAGVFDFDGPWFRWLPFGRVTAAVVPHPSGLNRVWNVAGVRAEAGRFFRDLATVS